MIRQNIVPDSVVKKVKDMLADPEVNQLWNAYVNLGQVHNIGDSSAIYRRIEAFKLYAQARDRYLGILPKPETVKH